MNITLLWQLAYRMAGPTILGCTDEEPLGALPVPLRNLVLQTVRKLAPACVHVEQRTEDLLYAAGTYTWISHWRRTGEPLTDPVMIEAATQLLDELPQTFRHDQLLALSILLHAVQQSATHISIVQHEPATASLALAVQDLVAVIERVAAFYDLAIALPSVTVTLVVQNPGLALTTLRDVAGALEAWSVPADCSRTAVHVQIMPEAPAAADYVVHQDTLNWRVEGVQSYISVTDARRWFFSQIGRQPPLEVQPVRLDRTLLDFFARRYFRVPELKPEQVTLIHRALQNESGLGLLPTGFGKSLVYQLYALLIPRTTLVISPLRALMRDQLHNLRRNGLVCAEEISASDTAKAKQEKLDRFQAFAYRLFYVAPERLQIEGFVEELEASVQHTPIGALVIDEAHCVSEWGHDFRPAYLQIGPLRRRLAEACRRPLPILALTATASEPVRKDILDVLDLPPDSVVQLASSDRPNLSFSVHPVSAPSLKPALIGELLSSVIPDVLGLSFEDLTSPDPDQHYAHAGVIFGTYANAHGRKMFDQGVHAIADAVVSELQLDPNTVVIHSSTAPTTCPFCQSALFITQGANNARRSTCQTCGQVFENARPAARGAWDTLVQQRQDAFQQDAFPLLVATKGYGMGIDKRNIRYIIHHGLASGLESYYQEAGRAGRDGQHAHAALVFVPPHPTCRERHLDAGELAPPCVAHEDNYTFYACPYYKGFLCEYGHQARFIRGAYPGVEEHTQRVLQVYDKLSRAIAKGGRKEIWDQKDGSVEHSLYRLQQLGIIETYTVQYMSDDQRKFRITPSAHWDVPTLLANLTRCLHRTGVGGEYIDQQVRRVHVAIEGDAIEDDRAPRDRALMIAVRILTQRIYDTVPRMRYQMLRNELEYASQQPDGGCRRTVIRGIFDTGAHITTADYRCGFCDSCVPTLKFTATSAAVPLPDAEMSYLASQLPALLDQFDPPSLQHMIQQVILYEADAGVLARLTSRLERDPTNLAALYLAGSLTARAEGRERLALEYLHYGFEESLRQGQGIDRVLLFYTAAADVDAARAFDWIARRDGPWDNDAGFRFLVAEATQRFGMHADQVQALLVGKHVQRLRAHVDWHAAVAPRIAHLRATFETMNTNHDRE